MYSPTTTDQMIDALAVEPSETEQADALESALEQAHAMSAWQLFNEFDDFDSILAEMPVDARNAYYDAHRRLVAQAIVAGDLA